MPSTAARGLPVLLALLAPACRNDVGYASSNRRLEGFSYVDAGAVAPGDRNVVVAPLFSEGTGRVTVFAAAVTDVRAPAGATADPFLVADLDWKDTDCDGDGTNDCRVLDGYDDHADTDTLALPVTFAPTAEGEYEATLTVWTNDSSSSVREPLPDGSGREWPIWRVQLRGLSRPACGRVRPPWGDFGPRPAGGQFSRRLTVENCGIVPLTVAAVHVDSPAMASQTSMPLYVLPGLAEEVDVFWTVEAERDDEPVPVETSVRFVSNSPTLDASLATLVGNLCEGSADDGWDADGDGWTRCAGDCDDADPNVSLSATERGGNGTDDDCDGRVDEAADGVSTDDDGDGASEADGDCDDADAFVGPDAQETANGVDDDCDGVRDDGTERVDDDGDGYSEREGDCDDEDRLVAPDATEALDGRDDDCDEKIDEGGPDVDDDDDGFAASADPALHDCDDQDAWVRPGGVEYCDGYDNDCDGVADEGDDDAPDGACAFLPARVEAEDAAEGEEAAAGCASALGPTAPGIALLAAAIGATRRRRDTPHPA